MGLLQCLRAEARAMLVCAQGALSGVAACVQGFLIMGWLSEPLCLSGVQSLILQRKSRLQS